MRIERVHIASFGSVRDATYRFGDGLTVVYGPNESGKTTLKSFVTGTMFPDRLPRYPAAAAGDSGEIDIVLGDGERVTVRRKGRRSDSPVPEICRLGGKEYVAIYSMGPDDLRGMETLEKGGIREKLLAVPGSDSIPGIAAEIAEEKKTLLTENRRSSTCTVSRNREAVDSAQRRLDSMRARDDGDSAYNSLCSEEARIRGDLEAAEDAAGRAFDARIDRAKADGLSGISEQIERLERDRSGCAYAEKVDIAAFNRMAAVISETERRLEAAESDSRAKAEALPGDAGSIVDLADRLRRFRRMAAESGGSRAPAAPGAAAVIGGIAIAVGGIAVAATVSLVVGIAAAAIGIVVTVAAAMRRKRGGKRADDPLESEWISLCAAFRIDRTSIPQDIDRMERLVEEADRARASARSAEACRSELDEKMRRMDSMKREAGIGGDISKAMDDKRRLEDIDSQLAALRRSAGSAPETPAAAPSVGFDEAKKRADALKRELGAIEEKRRSILEDRSTDQAQNDLAEKRNILAASIRAWTVLAIEAALLDEACARSYDRNRPAAYSDGDRFLGIMTDGRYRLVSDPKTTDLEISDTGSGVGKGKERWTSGTEDQVKLALKMGVARGLCEDDPPMILDDVLLTSDSSRKRGCAKAIAALSESMQVIFFTCDAETRDILKREGARVIELRSRCPGPVRRPAPRRVRRIG